LSQGFDASGYSTANRHGCQFERKVIVSREADGGTAAGENGSSLESTGASHYIGTGHGYRRF